MASRKAVHGGAFQAPWDDRRNPSNLLTAGTPRAAPAVSPGRVAYVSCAAARAAGAAPVRVGQPGYGRHLDRDRIFMTSQAERTAHARANAARVQLLREALAAQDEPQAAFPLDATGPELPCPPLEHVDSQPSVPFAL